MIQTNQCVPGRSAQALKILSTDVFSLNVMKPKIKSTSFNTIFCFSFTESIKKIVDKSSIKFIHGVKLDTKIGKTEDRILVSC